MTEQEVHMYVFTVHFAGVLVLWVAPMFFKWANDLFYEDPFGYYLLSLIWSMIAIPLIMFSPLIILWSIIDYFSEKKRKNTR